MKLLTTLTMAYISLCYHALADDWQKSIPLLADPSFASRQQAHNDILRAIHSKTSQTHLENSMGQLLVSYSHSNDPETQMRLLTIMQMVSEPYLQSLGTPFIGIASHSFSEKIDGKRTAMLFVDRVAKDTPAERAGIKSEDKILSIEHVDLRRKFGTADNFFDQLLKTYAPGETVALEILRGDSHLTLNVKLGQPQKGAVAKFFSTLQGTEPKAKPKPTADSTILKDLKRPIALPKQFDDGSFFSRWFKRHQQAP